MRFVIIVVLTIFSCVSSKINPKALTESMGQEVIEIGAPIKDLPPDLEEEPSAEVDEADKATSTTVVAGTPRDAKKITVIETRRKMKDIDKIENIKQEDDEARIEKELAEMYKDTDYKADSAEVTTEDRSASTANDTEKPIARMRNNFKFQPDRNNPREIERFRTSIDDINCSKSKLIAVSKQPNSGCLPVISRLIFWGLFVFI